jgi:hypothetical protein
MLSEVLIAARRRLDPTGNIPVFMSFFSSLRLVTVSGLRMDVGLKGTVSTAASSVRSEELVNIRIVLAD